MTDREIEEEFTNREDADVPILSASRIKTFKTCPRQFWFSRISDQEATQISPKRYRHLGSAVHEAIEHVLENGYNADTIVADLQRYYDQTEYIEEMDDDLINKGRDYLEVAGRYLLKMNYDVRDVEVCKEMRVDIGGRECIIRGIIDVTTEGYVVDWKTGSIRDDTDEDEKIQGSVYMKLYEELYGEKPEGVRFVYLKEEKQRELEVKEDHWDFTKIHANKLLDAVDRNEFTGEPWDAPCFFCDYRMHCPDVSAGVGNVEWEKF